MTKAEAAVMRAALRYLRAQMKMDSAMVQDQASVGGAELERQKATKDLLKATEAAAKELKDWVAVKQTANPNEPVVSCAGCAAEEKIKVPSPMNEILEAVNVFRGRHLDCGPVAEEAAKA